MNSQSSNETIIIGYLLGELPEEDLQRVERRFLEDEDLFNELEEIEDELVDDYVTGSLSVDRRAAFEKYFLRSAERRDKVEFAQALTERASLWKKTRETEVFNSALVADERSGESGAGSQKQAELLSKRWLRPVPAWRQWAAIAAAVVFAVASVGLWLKVSRLQRDLASTREHQVALLHSEAQSRKSSADLQSELSAEQKQTQALEEKINDFERLASLDPGTKIVYGIRIGIEHLSSDSKGEGTRKIKTLEIPAKAQLVRLSVEFEKTDFQTFKATLRRADGSSVWTRAGLKTRASGANQSLTLAIPADKLPAGDYELVVSGVTPEGNTESVGRYALKVVRNERSH
jgi:anti-sigma factor RsiW